MPPRLSGHRCWLLAASAATLCLGLSTSPVSSADDERVPSRLLPDFEPGVAAARLLEQGRWASALWMAEEAFHKRPDDPRSFSLLGECLWRAGHLVRAEEIFRRGTELDGGDGRLLAGSTRAHVASGRVQEALEASLRAVRADPQQPWSWIAQASSFAQRGKVDRAREALSRARKLMLGRRGTRVETARLRHAVYAVEAVAANTAAVEREHFKGRGELRIEGGFPLVDVEVEAAEGEARSVPMLVDTGASIAVALDASLRDQVAHTLTGRRSVTGFQRTTVAEQGTLASLGLGEWRFDDLPVLFYSLVDDARAESVDLPYRGILGPVISQGRVLALNLRRGGVWVRESDPDEVRPGEVSSGEIRSRFFLLGDGKVLLPVLLGSEPVLALLDTGALQSRRSERLSMHGMWGPVQIGGAVHRLRPPPAQPRLDDHVSPNLGVEVSLLLGMDFLMRYGIVTLDYPHRTLTLTPRDERRR